MASPRSILRALRFNDWWNYKIPPLFGFFALFAAQSELSFGEALPELGKILIWVLGAAGFGYYTNDVFDIREDKAAGKANAASGHSPTLRVIIGLVLAAVALFPWVFRVQEQPLPLILATVHLLSFLLYSVPPFRLKERGLWGPLMDGLYAHALPAAVILSMFFPFEGEGVWLAAGFLIAWQWAVGIRNLILHQFLTFERDEIAGTKSWVRMRGKERIGKLVNRLLIPLELSLLTALSALVLVFMSLWPVLGMGLIALLNLPKYIWFHRFNFREIRHLMHFFNDLYEEWLAPCMLLILAIQLDPWYLLVLAVYFLFFQNLPARLRDDFLRIFA